MHKILSLVILMTISLFVVSSADSDYEYRVVKFDKNWGEHPLFNLVSESPIGVEVVFSMHKMMVEERVIDGNRMKAFCIPGIFLPNSEGAPNLAGTGRYIAIPQGARAQVTIVDTRTEVYHDVEIAPAPNIPLDSDDSPLRYAKDMKIYGRNAYYPETPVKLSEPSKIRGVDVVILGIMPFKYNPVTKDLIIYKDIRIRVDFVGGNGHFGEDRLRSRFWEPILQGHLLNYNSLSKIDLYSHSGDRFAGYEYIIIVPDDSAFVAWADTIRNWRKLQGISSEVFTLTEIGGSSVDNIRNFLQDAYYNWNIAPVAFLLLGDYELIPSPSLPHPSPRVYTYISDNWYADFHGDGYFNADGLPDLHHARICAQNDEHLQTIINKFLSYERYPYTDSDFYDHPLVACVWETSRWFQISAEIIRGFFINSLGKTPVRQYVYNTSNDTNPQGRDGEWSNAANTGAVVHYWYDIGWLPDTLNPYDEDWWDNGGTEGIINAINSGAFLVQHRDHGGVTGWEHPSFHNSDLDNLTNTMFPFVYSTNCLTGKFDILDECFTEKFHRIEHGALGVNSASEVSYSFVNDTYIWGTYDGLWPQFDPSYGPSEPIEYRNPCMAMTYGKYYLAASSFTDSMYDDTTYKKVTYGLFHHHGDAFTPLYSEVPQRLAVMHQMNLPFGQTHFGIRANTGSVIALTVNGEIIGVAVATGALQYIEIAPQNSAGTLVITVTKPNYFRHRSSVPIGPVHFEKRNVCSDGWEQVVSPSLEIYPTLCNSHLNIYFSVGSEGSEAKLRIYSVSGRLVKEFSNAEIQSFNPVIWQGDDNSGSSLPAGVYFVKLESGDFKAVKKVTLLR